MEISLVSDSLMNLQADALAVGLFEPAKTGELQALASVPALIDYVLYLVDQGEITGAAGELTLIHTPSSTYPEFGPKRLLITGLGKPEAFTLSSCRRAIASVMRKLRSISADSAVTELFGAEFLNLDPELTSEAVCEGALLGLYRFEKYRSKTASKKQNLSKLFMMYDKASDLPALEKGLWHGQVMARAAMLARDLVNEPANRLSPDDMATVAEQIAQNGDIVCQILSREECEREGMGAYLAVAQGSVRPPRLIHMTYEGNPDTPHNNVWLIGKSITFDSGGVSLKPSLRMGDMKGDMGGGAAVLAAMQAISEIRPRINVHAVCPATENMPSGSAQRPGDVVKAMNGLYIEVENTDAEGRLTLADAICYAKKNSAARIVDAATLTGAVRVALGGGNAAGYSNDTSLLQEVIRAGRRHGDNVWSMPLDDPIADKERRSEIADLTNTGGATAGSVKAAQFLAEFAEDTPWVHLDMAGVNIARVTDGEVVKGATGAVARLLAQLALNLAELTSDSLQ